MEEGKEGKNPPYIRQVPETQLPLGNDRRGLNKTEEWINTNIYRGLDEYRKWVFLGRRGLSARISADGDPLTHMVMGSVFCGTVMMMIQMAMMMIACCNILQ